MQPAVSLIMTIVIIILALITFSITNYITKLFKINNEKGSL